MDRGLLPCEGDDKNGVIDAVVRDLQTLYGTGNRRSPLRMGNCWIASWNGGGTALEAIVRRHGPMVWGVCRRVLHDHHDAEDAFQATFLCSHASRLRSCHGRILATGSMAWRTDGHEARVHRGPKGEAGRARCRTCPSDCAPDDLRDERVESLDRELSRLPEKYRIPIVLCDLEGRTHNEAASQLGWPVGTVSSRLSRARSMLARRLSQRGVPLSVGSLAVLLAQESVSAGMPTRLIGSTAQAASLFAAGGAATAGGPAVAAPTTALLVMLLGKLKIATVTLHLQPVAAQTGVAYRAEASEFCESALKAPGTKAPGPTQ